jgi:carbamoyl-phosphate synthase small subunit
MPKRWLALEDGEVFVGTGFGAALLTAVLGEVVFTTNMTGYTETLTDPSYEGQIVLQTFPLIGNYGVNPADLESRKSFVTGYIVKEACAEPSHFATEGNLNDFLQAQGIPGLSGIDTRTLTKRIRRSGVLRGILTDNPDDIALDKMRAFFIGDAVSRVTVQAPVLHTGENPRRKVVLWDFGVKESSIRCLNKRGCDVLVVPSFWTCEQIAAEEPDGVLLSNGPGDPEVNTAIIAEIAKLCKSGIPIFGICLGHQLLALANGGKTRKLKYGHRGANHPVCDLVSGRTYITTQNHGYAVSLGELPPEAALRWVNANDSTCEGLDYSSFNGFSVQFHPEACGGPRDTEFLFDRFIANIDDKPASGTDRLPSTKGGASYAVATGH